MFKKQSKKAKKSKAVPTPEPPPEAPAQPGEKHGARKRLAWVRHLKNQLCSVVLSDRHKHHGRDLAGFRVVRILRCLYDRKLRQVVVIIARLYGGDQYKFGGWNGIKVRIAERRLFTGTPGKGILEGKETIPVDSFIRRPKEKRGVPEMVKSGKSRTPQPPTGATETISGSPSTSEAPETPPAHAQPPSRPNKRGRGPRKPPPMTLAPRIKGETDGPELPQADEFAIDEADDVELPPNPYEDLSPAEIEPEIPEPDDVEHERRESELSIEPPPAAKPTAAKPKAKATPLAKKPAAKKPEPKPATKAVKKQPPKIEAKDTDEVINEYFK